MVGTGHCWSEDKANLSSGVVCLLTFVCFFCGKLADGERGKEKEEGPPGAKTKIIIIKKGSAWGITRGAHSKNAFYC